MKKKFIIGIPILLIIIICSFIFFNQRIPENLPENSTLIDEIESTLDGRKVDKILDRQLVGERHAFFPYIGENGRRGISVWSVEKGKWTLGAVSNGGEPALWKIDQDNPDTFYFVWNLHPDDQVEQLEIFFERERNFNISGSQQRYIPQIFSKDEMENNKDYGVQAIPESWKELLEQQASLEQPQKTGPAAMFNHSESIQPLQLSYVPYNEEGEHIQLDEKGGQYSFYNGEQLDMIPWVDPSMLKEEQLQ
ncbi:hypothetical protein [Halobacillus sp. A5]|uniref:hypothetical protein n=1 Tax=Halobacillus sp. A5 TaxID=2880263 RepID=UPI0020A6C64B|nr:hypothetical protein [Halobacillus sp. A5]MCP3029165.1 hypothetical protein [Halobacillus sp. A5]